MKTFGREYKAKILDRILVELTFVRPGIQAVLLESAKDFFYVLPVRDKTVNSMPCLHLLTLLIQLIQDVIKAK
jgi:hypothetical protein